MGHHYTGFLEREIERLKAANQSAINEIAAAWRSGYDTGFDHGKGDDGEGMTRGNGYEPIMSEFYTDVTPNGMLDTYTKGVKCNLISDISHFITFNNKDLDVKSLAGVITTHFTNEIYGENSVY